jgi:hypothetical protein
MCVAFFFTNLVCSAFSLDDLRAGPGLYRINRRLPFFVSAGVMGVCALALLRVKSLPDDAEYDRNGTSRAQSADGIESPTQDSQTTLLDKVADADSATVFVQSTSDFSPPSRTSLIRNAH